MTDLFSVILAGGVGTRLWPLSRTYYPKQFLIMDKPSLFQETYKRALRICDTRHILVITNESHQYLVKNQIEDIKSKVYEENILIESVGKNTLPAITWAMTTIEERVGEGYAAIFPSDHSLPVDAMDEIKTATDIADDYLVTFGVIPKSPHTGYGYINPGNALKRGFLVNEFKEKPSVEQAEEFVRAGFLWNSGMFFFSTRMFREEMERYEPELLRTFNVKPPDYKGLPVISIDYGLLEHSKRVGVIPLHAPWSDLGNFRALYEAAPHDADGNTGNAVFIDANSNYVYTPGKKTALIGVNNLSVVDTGDALLVCNTSETERVGDLVKYFKSENDPVIDYHLQVHRPWGSYTDLERSRFYRIKRVTVKPGVQLSLQMHHHRSEHWIIVSGMADVTLNKTVQQFRNGESTFVPAGTLHRLGNSGKIPLEVIEVQIGEYLEEDDIVRIEDDFNRVDPKFRNDPLCKGTP